MNRLKQGKTSHRRTALSLALYSAGIFGALAAVPNAHAVPFTGLLDPGNQLVTFDSATPNTISTPIAVTGLQPLEGLVSIDFRPATGELVGFGNLGNIYSIVPPGAATGTPGAATILRGNGGTDFINDAGFYGWDFNPVIDQIRLTSDISPTNRRIMLTGAVNDDGNLTYAAGDPNFGDTPEVDASAYTNNFGPAAPATTVLYSIDAGQAAGADVLVMHGPPTNSTLTTVGPLGVDFGILNSFEIVGANQAFASAGSPFTGGIPSTLYSINLATGAATLVGATAALSTIGPSGGTQRVIGITSAIAGPPPATPGAIQFSPATLTVAENVGNAGLTVTRPAGSTGAATVTATPTSGTAVAPGDFTATPILVTFGAAELSKPVPVPITDDTTEEGNETFTVVLSAPTGGATLGAASTATVTISANDSPAPPAPPPPAGDDDGGCTVNANGKDAGLLMLLLGGALAALRRRMKR